MDKGLWEGRPCKAPRQGMPGMCLAPILPAMELSLEASNVGMPGSHPQKMGFVWGGLGFEILKASQVMLICTQVWETLAY